MPLLLTRRDVESVLTMKEAIAAVEEGLTRLALGRAIMPQRTAIRMVDGNVFGAEGHEWFRTPGGVRRVKNSAVQSYLKRSS